MVPAMWGQEVEVRSYGHNAVRIDGAMAQLYKEIIKKTPNIIILNYKLISVDMSFIII